MLVLGFLVLLACYSVAGQYYFLATNGRDMTPYDIFRTLGPHVDHFEVAMDYVERRINYEMRRMPKFDPDYVDFIFRQGDISIERGPYSLTYINHHRQSIKLRNKIQRKAFRLSRKFKVMRTDENQGSQQETTPRDAGVAKALY